MQRIIFEKEYLASVLFYNRPKNFYFLYRHLAISLANYLFRRFIFLFLFAQLFLSSYTDVLYNPYLNKIIEKLFFYYFCHLTLSLNLTHIFSNFSIFILLNSLEVVWLSINLSSSSTNVYSWNKSCTLLLRKIISFSRTVF